MPITRDVVIWGLTPQAIFSAIVIARGGRTVTMVGPDHQVGGMLTGGLGITDAPSARTWWGPVKEFADALSAITNFTNERLRWCFAPKDAQGVFASMLAAEPNIEVRYNEKLVSITDSQLNVLLGQNAENVKTRGSRIRSFATNVETYTAPVFIDASYGCDLAALAGVPQMVGREARSFADEIQAGITFEHTFDATYHVVDANGDLINRATHRPHELNGQADRRTMATGFRHCLTNIPANRLPWVAPNGYNVNDFAAEIAIANQIQVTIHDINFGWVLRRTSYNDAAAATHIVGYDGMTRSQREAAWLSFTTASEIAAYPDKFATNGSDIVGPLAWEYTYADDARRAEIRSHLYYREMGRWFTFATRAEVPQVTRDSFSAIGFCADEWQTVNGGSPGFPPEIYHRTGRRIKGQAIINHWHVMYQTNWADQIAVGGYFADSKAKTEYAKFDGGRTREGTYGEGSFITEDGVEIHIENFMYFGIPLRSVVAERGVADNLAVCWGISATEMAFTAIRLEPFLSSVATAVGHMALESITSGVPMAQLPYAPVRARLDAAGAYLFRY